MNETTKSITLQDILIWVIQNQNDTDAMDKLNRATYSYTSKFLNRSANGYYQVGQSGEAGNDDRTK